MFGVGAAEVDGVIRRARRWLTTKSRSLMQVGSLAGLDCKQIDLLLEINRKRYWDERGRIKTFTKE